MLAIDNIPTICVLLLVGTIVLYPVYLELFAYRLPKDLPSVGFRNEIFSRSRASFRQILRAPDVAEKGYKLYGEKHRSYVIPHSSFRPQVMLSQKHIKWLAAQPESVLNPEVVRLDRQGITFFPLVTDSRTILMAAHKIIAEALNQGLDTMQPEVYDGIRYAVDKMLGTDTTSWQEFPMMETMSTIVDSAVSRVMFGASLSRNEGFLRMMRGFIIGGGVLTELVGQLPFGLLRPVLGVPFSLFTLATKKLCVVYLRPQIKERMLEIDGNNNDQQQPNTSFDFITQCIRSVRKFKFPIGTDETTFIADMLMFLALAGVVSTRTTSVNTFMDILGVGSKHDTYETLRLEAESIFRSEADWTSPTSLKNMTNIDSALRESARKNPLQTRGLLKQVMPRDGITLPDGAHVPQGAWLGIPVEAIHRDEALYPSALEFDALRFARLKGEGSPDGRGVMKNLDAAQPSDSYMFFSYGRSACPGRWFATRVMKLLIAYITLHYDIKPLTDHPERLSLGDTKFYQTSVKLVVRRRKLD